MDELRVVVITPNQQLLEELELYCSFLASPVMKLWQKGKELFRREGTLHYPASLSLETMLELQVADDPQQVYILDIDAYSLDDLNRVFIQLDSELVILYEANGHLQLMELDAKLDVVINRTTNLTLLRKPLVRLELEIAISSIMKKRTKVSRTR
ncbi:hypothetical protein DNH61_17420 [Paenibacillus sambharensis]|uniref:Uncharacterized protein n=1 Tax=Paenibacillus sambharensis TaxID=1803190 RepID=A0A2W1L3Y6_9BACL|nr:hypothetical protein [Paenibacillus sambharensis]PZD94728.1 hypothetical protein DNH61_17420 [Paenibacillus sambharensis]